MAPRAEPGALATPGPRAPAPATQVVLWPLHCPAQDIWLSVASLCLLAPPSRSSPLHPSLVCGSKVRSVQQFNVGSLPEEVPVVNFIQQEAAIKCRRASKIPSHFWKRRARPPGCGRQNCWGAMCSRLRFVSVCTRPSASGIHRLITTFRRGSGPSVRKMHAKVTRLEEDGQGVALHTGEVC